MVSWYPKDPGGDGFVPPPPAPALQAAFLWSVTVIAPQEMPFPRAFPRVTGIYLHTPKSVGSGCAVWGIFPQVLAESSVVTQIVGERTTQALVPQLGDSAYKYCSEGSS